MKGYLIGRVCELLDVGPHVLRYWERELPIISPKKDEAGRRVYTRQEVNILLRLRYLIYTRKFTLPGAQEELLKELTGSGGSVKVQIGKIRSELLYIEGRLREQQKKIDEVLSRP
ncbi:MAG: MerR family transcriptional regulator [Spirochaetaceae bacterium]